MDTTEHLRALGEETLYMENIYLNLKIEKALAGDKFDKESLLSSAESLWKEIDNEYYNFLNFLLNNHKQVAW